MSARALQKPGRYTRFVPTDASKACARTAVPLRHLGELTDRIRVLEKIEKKQPRTNRGKKHG
jgi:hypothetical protein